MLILFVLFVIGYFWVVSLDYRGALKGSMALGIGILLIFLVRQSTPKEGYFFEFLIHLGRISYEIYCLHFPIILFTLCVLDSTDQRIREIGVGHMVPYIYILTSISTIYLASLWMNRLTLNLRNSFLTNYK